MSAWIVRTIDFGRSRFWGLVFDEFMKMDMGEETRNLLRMPPELVASFGATDVSLLETAASFESGNSILLSVDGALIKECNDAGLSAMHLWEVIAT